LLGTLAEESVMSRLTSLRGRRNEHRNVFKNFPQCCRTCFGSQRPFIVCVDGCQKRRAKIGTEGLRKGLYGIKR
jgi:hypothetical protein